MVSLLEIGYNVFPQSDTISAEAINFSVFFLISGAANYPLHVKKSKAIAPARAISQKFFIV